MIGLSWCGNSCTMSTDQNHDSRLKNFNLLTKNIPTTKVERLLANESISNPTLTKTPHEIIAVRASTIFNTVGAKRPVKKSILIRLLMYGAKRGVMTFDLFRFAMSGICKQLICR